MVQKNKKTRLGCLSSGGKDSLFSLYLANKQKYDISCLISIKPINEFSFMFHNPDISLLELQKKALDIPIILQKTKGEKEKELRDLEKAVKKAKNKFKIKAISVGALASEYQSKRVKQIANKLGLEVFSPLWKKSQESYLQELITNNFLFTLTKITSQGIPTKFLGKILGMEDIKEIIYLSKKFRFNPAFEGGEAETFVLDMPLFKKKIVFEEKEIKSKGEFEHYLVVKKARLKPKYKHSQK